MTVKRSIKSFAEYEKVNGVNFSALKFTNLSPLHYRSASTTAREPTDAMILGAAIHAAVFEPDAFLDDYVTFRGDRRKSEWKSYQEEHADKDILRPEEYDACLSIRDAVRNHHLVRPLLTKGKAEQTITWTDPETGIACKGRLDWMAKACTVDLKSVVDISQHGFGSAAARYHWHVQGAWYRWGRALATCGEPLPFLFVAVEKKPPFDVAVYELEGDPLAVGSETFRRWLRALATALERDEWPGMATAVMPLQLPAWALGQCGPGVELVFDEDQT